MCVVTSIQTYSIQKGQITVGCIHVPCVGKFFLIQKVKTSTVAHSACYSTETGILSSGKKQQDIEAEKTTQSRN